MSDSFQQARDLFARGLELCQSGRFDLAEQQFLGSLALVPGRASTLTNLGIARFFLGRFEDAVAVLEEALEQEPDNIDAWAHLAMAQSERGQLHKALLAIEQALLAAPGLGLGWSLKGNLLKDLGRLDEAADAYERALALGHEVELTTYYLAGLRGGETPPAPPADYVRLLFDGYASQFEEHLGVLQYKAPELLAQPLRERGLRVPAALDLGCGTGLCGPVLREFAQQVDGVDVSARMLALARRGGAYRHLVQAELVEHLAATPERYGLVLAADVLIYVGAPQPVFQGVARVIEPEGIFAFTVEEAVFGKHLELQPSLRYAHSESSLRWMAVEHGFDVLLCRRGTIREDQGQPVAGLYFWLRHR